MLKAMGARVAHQLLEGEHMGDGHVGEIGTLISPAVIGTLISVAVLATWNRGREWGERVLRR